jgi:hypothetical protein
MKKLPQLVYHLRRSHFVNRFGISLDESYYIGYMMNRESIVNTISMIHDSAGLAEIQFVKLLALTSPFRLVIDAG